ncbi:MAG: metal-dependent hydrolase [Leptospirales bacterium]
MTDTNRLTWLGHSTFLIDTSDGKRIMIDPWLSGNPSCPSSFRKIEGVTQILLTHAHFDHIGDAVPLALETGAQVVGIFELCHWMGRKGIRNTLPMNKGGTQEVNGITITMVHADHSCGISEGDEILYGGEACGYVMTLPDGFKVYHSGDTNVFSDMKLIGSLYRPDLVLLPIGSLYTMGPVEAAHAVRFLGVTEVVPMHYGTFPTLTGTPEEFRRQLMGEPFKVRVLKPGESLEMVKKS